MKNWRLHHYLLLIVAMSTILVLTPCIWYTTAIGDIDRLFYRQDASVILGHIELNGQIVSDQDSMRYLTQAITQGKYLGQSFMNDDSVNGFVSQRFLYSAVRYCGRYSDGFDGVVIYRFSDDPGYFLLRVGPDCPAPLRELFERNQPPASVRRIPAP